MNYPIYKFSDYITEEDIYSIDNYSISLCPFAITILMEKYPHKINSDGISLNSNPLVISYLKENPSKINWNFLSSNPNAISLLRANQNKINWKNLSMNNCAYKLLFENQDKIDWTNICYNDNPKIVGDIISKNLNKDISWTLLSKNNTDEAIDILKANQNKIDWRTLSFNENDKAFDLINDNLDKINWENLSTNSNPKIIEIFEKNQDKISWQYLAINTNEKIKDYMCKNIHDKKDIIVNHCNIYYQNYSIYEYIDYVMSQNSDNEVVFNNWLNCKCYYMYKLDVDKMKSNFETFEEELIKEAYHPKRICKLIEAGIDIEEIF